jgi:two-component system, chemotaxis family, sensor kinase CheA
MEDRELITDFLVESGENLARLDLDLVALEKTPGDSELLASVFRTFHTLKGTCGFLGYTQLGNISHHAENILSQLREGVCALTPELVSLILETVDAIKGELVAIEQKGEESGNLHEELSRRLGVALVGAGQALPETLPGPQEPEVDDGGSRQESADIEPDEVAHPAGLAENSVGVATHPDAGADAKGPVGRSVSAADSTIRVDVGLLDRLMNLVGELVLARNQILQFNATQEDTVLNGTSQRLNLITTQLQEGVMKTRMQPIGVVWNKLPRVVRDLAVSCGKQIVLEMDGAETELDKSIIEAIKDPLTHIVRNCGDHGIEPPAVRVKAGKSAQGRLLLRAFHEGGQVNIEISDDGGGIDPLRIKELAIRKGLLRPESAERMSDREAIALVFLPGFSTAEQVTSVSGRGVGMDVVKTNIEKIGGTVDLASVLGEGTTVKIKIPLTLAIIPGLVVTMGDRRSFPRERETARGGDRFVIPQVSLQELIRLEGDAAHTQIESIHGTPVYRRRGRLLPIVYLDEVLKMSSEGRSSEVVNIVVLQAEERQFGLIVDGISDTQEIVVKPLGKQLKGLNCYAGGTIMGDGKVALILDVMGLGQRAGVVSEIQEQARADGEHHEQGALGRQTFLLFSAGGYERLAVPLSLVARLEEIPLAKIESAGGRHVVQYRGEILPLINLGAILDSGADAAVRADPAQVVVFHNGDRRIGLLVDKIVDFVEESITIRNPTSQTGLVGSAVIGQRVTDLLDMQSIIRRADVEWFGHEERGCCRTVLVADASIFTRGMVRSYLEMAGHRVIEAGSVEEAVTRLKQHSVDLVFGAMDLPSGGVCGLLEALRRQQDTTSLRVVGLLERAEEMPEGAHVPAGLAGCCLKSDRAAIVAAVEEFRAKEAELELAGVGGRA